MKVHLPEILFFGGLAVVGAGCWMVWPPLCPIVVGVVLMILGVLGALRWGS